MRRLGKNSRAGYTMIEICVAVIIICILVSIGVPVYTKAIEQARLDGAAGNLKTIWSAQRAYWLKNRTFASSLTILEDEKLISVSVARAQSDPNSIYVYEIDSADAGSFTASAVRNGSAWNGEITIDENGGLGGSISKAGSTIVLEPLTME